MKKNQKILSSVLRDAAEGLDKGTLILSDAQKNLFICLFNAKDLSKEEAACWLNISRAKFDKLVASGEIPQGVKKRGFKELIWYSYDLERYREKSVRGKNIS